MNCFTDKVAVVTGAGGTLCSCIAKDLASKGAKVVLIGRTREKLEKVASEIMGGSRIEPGDVTDEKSMQEIADRVEQAAYNSGDAEISSQRIGDMVMAELKQVNDVAYVRFAAVYRKFTDVGTFMVELQKLVDEKM